MLYILHVEVYIIAYLCIFCAFTCIFKAYCLHITWYFCIIAAYVCIFRCLSQLILYTSLYIYCMIEHTNAYIYAYSSSAGTFGPFLIHSCSTSQQQLHINRVASKHIHLRRSGKPSTHQRPGSGGRRGVQLLAHRPLACQSPFSPSAPIGEPNWTGR